MTEQEKENEEEKIRLVYAGIRMERRRGSRKPAYLYYEVDENNKLKPATDSTSIGKYEHQIYKEALTPGRPGIIYEFRKSENGVFTSSATFIDQYDDVDQVTEWQIEHDANNQILRSEKESKKIGNMNLPYEYLEPFREAYHRSGHVVQAQIIANVVRRITSHRKQ